MKTKLPLNSGHWVLITALLAAGYTCYLLIQPYINSIVMAFILSLLMSPFHQRIENRLPNSPNTASFLSCIVLTFIIVIPLLVIFAAIVQQGSVASQNVYHWVSNGGIDQFFAQPWLLNIVTLINEYSPFDNIEPQQIAQKLAQFSTTFGSRLVSISAKILGDATNFLVNFFLMLFVLFFLFRDHDRIIRVIRHVFPLSRSQEDKLLDEIEKVSKSAVMGSFLTALAQGVAGGIGMLIVGFPALFWGTVMGFTSFIPVVGTALIWLPATAYLLLTGETGWAVFLALWSITVVGSIDNLLRPFLMQGSAGMNTLMIFFSLLGGIHVFGLIGLIYGPLIFAITIVLFNIYEEEFHHFLHNQDKN